MKPAKPFGVVQAELKAKDLVAVINKHQKAADAARKELKALYAYTDAYRRKAARLEARATSKEEEPG